jgi:hypothetical protein
MSAVGGIYRDGKVVLDKPVDWAEGTRVYVQVTPMDYLIEGVWPDDGSPSGNAELERRSAAFEALEVTEEDAADFEAALKLVREASRRTELPKSDSGS